MSDRIDYPPTETITLGVALEAIEADLRDIEARTEELESELPDEDSEEDPDPATTKALREKRSEQSTLSGQQDALEWATDEWGPDEEIALEALTTADRDRARDALRNERMGEVTNTVLQRYIAAQCLTSAPWLESNDDIHDRAEVLGELPPGFSDWLQSELDDLNDLGN
jgi:hypothetical protein